MLWGIALKLLPRRDFLRLFGCLSIFSFLPGRISCQTTSAKSRRTKDPAVHLDLSSFLKRCKREDELSLVSVAVDPKARYPKRSPFNPSMRFPEYPFSGKAVSESSNRAYTLVREALRLYNPKDFGKPGWNPLGKIIRKGDTVLIKPNFVEIERLDLPKTTHPAVIRAVIDYVYKACGKSGKIIVGEGTAAANDFDVIVNANGMRKTVNYLRKYFHVPVTLMDFNRLPSSKAPGIDLGSDSEFFDVRGALYDHHDGEVESWGSVGAYRIASPVLAADVVISIPKIKVHISAGVTLTLKNMLGAIPSWDGPYGDRSGKDCPHYSSSDRSQGSRGIYLNNDTIWRSVADVNKIILNWKGGLRRERQRRYLSIADGIIAGQKSQYNPTPKKLGCIVVSEDPVAFDALCARAMGFDYRKIRSIVKSSTIANRILGFCNPRKILIRSNLDSLANYFKRSRMLQPEVVTYPWSGHIEIERFAKPRMKPLKIDRQKGIIMVEVKISNEISFVRLSFSHKGRRYIFDLSRTGKDIWSAKVPVANLPAKAQIIASDTLFNETRLTIG